MCVSLPGSPDESFDEESDESFNEKKPLPPVAYKYCPRSLQKYKIGKIVHHRENDGEVIYFQMKHLNHPDWRPTYAIIHTDKKIAAFDKPPESKYHPALHWGSIHGATQDSQPSPAQRPGTDHADSTSRNCQSYL